MLRQKTLSPVPSNQPMAIDHHRLPEQTIRHTYAHWMQRFPRWVNTGFNEEFLLHDALPQLRAMLACGDYLTPAQLAHTWVTVFSIPQEHMQQAVAECTLVATDFLMRLQLDYCAQ